MSLIDRLSRLKGIEGIVDKLWVVLDFLFPKRCVGCQRVGSLLCIKCRHALPYVFGQYCPVCAKGGAQGFTHPACRSKYAPERLISAFFYRGAVREALCQLKYREALVISHILGALVAEYLEKFKFYIPSPFTLLPVPLHPLRYRERSYNQADLLAVEFSQRLGLVVERDLVVRTKDTPRQVELSGKERRRNVTGAFSVSSPEKVVGRDFCVVDDVWTTGATTKEIARVLKKAGAKNTWIVTVARSNP